PWLGFSALGEVYLAGMETASTKPPARPIVPPRPETGSLGQSLACVNAKDEDGCERAGCTWFLRSCMTPANALAVKLAMEKTPPAATKCDGVEAQIGNEKRCLKPKDTFRDCPNCPEMVVVPVGSFTMGSPASEPERNSDEVQVRVIIPAPFAAGRYAVTFDEFDACVADGVCYGYKAADQGWGRGKRPIINISWDEAKSFVAWLTKKT